MLLRTAILALVIQASVALPAPAQEKLPNAKDPRPATEPARRDQVAIVSLPRKAAPVPDRNAPGNPPEDSAKAAIAMPLTPPSAKR